MIKTSRLNVMRVSALLTSLFAFETGAETVLVKYRGLTDLTQMTCERFTRSSFINRLCYDAKAKYVVVQLDSTYYHYCDVPALVVSNWRAAESMGRYYDSQVKGRFDCRKGYVPQY